MLESTPFLLAIEDIITRIDDELACNGWIPLMKKTEKHLPLRATCLFEAWARETGNYPFLF
jgi:hypothetical protein